MSFYAELKRRNVLRIGAAYLVAAWLLIQIAETIFPLFGFGDGPARIVVVVLAIGLLPALVLAWVFELTPDGLKKDRDVDRTRPVTRSGAKVLDRAIIVVLVLALAYFAVDKFVLSGYREASIAEEARREGHTEAVVGAYGDRSIAVLAFEDMSPDKDQEYLADGIAEELLNLLAKIPELRVTSRSSSFSFKDQNLAVPEIAERLNVGYILEGSVRTANDRVRITAQLIDARSDANMLSETYDRRLDDIFAIQDEIAAQVVEQLKVRLIGTAPHVESTDPEVYGVYLQARFLARQGSAEALEEATSLYEKALAMNPEYAAAWAALASSYTSQAARGFRPWDEGFSLARSAVDKALALDDRSAIGYDIRARIAAQHDRDLTAAAHDYERALALEPTNPGIIGDVAVFMNHLGRPDDAVTLNEYLVSVDPVTPIRHLNLGYSYLAAHRSEDAIAALRTSLRLHPALSAAHCLVGTALLLDGRVDEAFAEMQKEPFEPLRLIGEAMVQFARGEIGASDSTIAAVTTKYPDWAYNFAYMHAFRHENDRAFEWLGKAVELGDPGLSEIVVEPMFGNLRDDPRWLPFLASIGKSPYELGAIQFRPKPPK